MQVNNVQSVNFNAKQRFLSPETTKNMQTLLSKMNKETVLQQGVLLKREATRYRKLERIYHETYTCIKFT